MTEIDFSTLDAYARYKLMASLIVPRPIALVTTIDEAGVVRSQIVNDLPIGRNIDETIRTVDALIFHEQHGEVCPAGWKDGDKGMDASPEGVAKYLAENADKL